MTAAAGTVTLSINYEGLLLPVLLTVMKKYFRLIKNHTLF